MRRVSLWLSALAAGLLLAAGVTAYAVGAGGFPSRPWLQALGVGAPAPAISGEMKATGNVIVSGSGPADTVAYTADGVELLPVHGSLRFWSYQAPTDEKLWDSYTDTSGALHYRTVNDADTLATDWLTISRSGYTPTAINFPSGTVEFGGLPAAVRGARITVSSTACSIASQGGSTFTGCSRLNVGKYQISYGNIGTPTCVADIINSPGYGTQTQIPSTTSVEVDVLNMSNGTFFDLNGTAISLLCTYQ